MLLKKITIDNYGLYHGETSFNLSPRKKYGKFRPVILFGGQNGAGKTTLFEAFKILLYGKRAFGNRVSEAEYKRNLRNKIHRSVKGVLQPQSASITLEFDHISSGEKHNIVAKRAWTASNAQSVNEKLTIQRDRQQVNGVTDEYWQGFVEEIIPSRLSSLFFFDGEKIKSIADDANGNEALAKSIKTLLGLDIVERLTSDLSIYRSKEAQKHSNEDFNRTIKTFEHNIANYEEQIAQLGEDLAENQTQLDGVNSEIANCERRLQQEGHVFAQQRDDLIRRKAETVSAIDEARRKAKEEYEGLYPFSLCPTITEDLITQLKADQAVRRGRIVEGELANIKKTLLDRFATHSDSSITETISKLIDQTIKDSCPNEFKDIYGLSDEDSNKIVNWIDRANTEIKPQVTELSKKVEALTGDLRRIELEILKAPSDSILRPIVERLNKYNKRLGMLQQARKKLDDDLRVKGNLLSDLKRGLEKTVAQFKSNDDTGQRVDLAGRIQKAMGDYADKLTRAKIEELRDTVATCFNSISRKEDLISEIAIDPNTFAVTLYDRHGSSLPKEELSAGEKQMYAVAMLWGLSKTSGRPLPVIIDTPLGRLDSEHRRKLIKNYFPQAAEQVLILSTDTEIDQQWYKELSPNTSHCFQLAYDHKNNCTHVQDGYFWRE